MPETPVPARFRLPLSAHADPELRAFLNRLAVLVVVILALIVAGTVGFALTEDVSLWRGFIWTLDTIATVGSIPNPEDTAAQVLQVVLIVLGVGTLFYALVTVAEFFVAGHLSGLLSHRRAQRMIDSISDHHLICGFGRVGRQAARDLAGAGERVVVIDSDPANREVADELGYPFIEGSASSSEVLKRAGIERARTVLACVDSDAENVFLTLTARELRPELTIIARASVEDSESKLRRAGADAVVSPYKSSGAEMARSVLRPQVQVEIDVSPEYRMEQIEVPESCQGAGCPVSEVRGSTIIVALHHPDGEVEIEPPAEAPIESGDMIVAVGSDEAMDELESRFAPV
jgi:voltage-gated potassium channel